MSSLRFRAFSVLFVALVLCQSCDRERPPTGAPAPPKAESAPVPSPTPGESEVAGLGGAVPGFLEWVADDAASAIVYRFSEDTDGDGQLDPELGDHGEPLGDEPTATLIDFVAKSTSDWDEVVATDVFGRHAVLRRGNEVHLFTAATRATRPLADATTAADVNACMASRLASFEPSGRWLSWLLADGKTVRLLDLRTDATRDVVSEGLLWRADAGPNGWLVLREVASDTNGDGVVAWPTQKSSCVCRWCKRFAASAGEYGWEGDEHRMVLVTPTGDRHQTSVTQPIPVGGGAFWSLPHRQLQHADGRAHKLPDDRCRLLTLPLGAEELVLRCGAADIVYTPALGTYQRATESIDAVEVFGPAFDGWVAVRVRPPEGGTFLGRLSLVDGTVERGPAVDRVGTVHPSGWVLGATGDAVHAFHAATGSSRAIAAKATTLGRLGFAVADEWRVIDPTSGATTPTERPPRMVANNGCFVLPDGPGLQKGPWRVECPKAPPAAP